MVGVTGSNPVPPTNRNRRLQLPIGHASQQWKKYGNGCWPSLSPDNNLLLWIFGDDHRNLTLFRTKTDEHWVVNINNAPGIDGFEVYHPRWSNHPLFMAMTGPYKVGRGDSPRRAGENLLKSIANWVGDNRIRGGGKEVEIYLGRFSQDFKKIERWIQVTHNQSADFYPDLWLSPPAKPDVWPKK